MSWTEWFNKLREDEVMVMLAIARKKYNEKLKSEQIIFREVVDKENWRRKFNKLKTLVHHYPSEARPEDYTIYLTYNPRSVVKAWILLKQRMIDWESQALFSSNLSDMYKHLKKFDREFISCLQKPEARSRKWHFLIDVDDLDKLDEVRKQIDELNLEVKHEEQTKNGLHILVKPFNLLDWKPIDGVEIKRDGVFHIYHVGGEDETKTA